MALGFKKFQKAKSIQWRKYGFEFFSIFIAVISAFGLKNWNENRREARSENKILTEIRNGLQKDLDDINLNILGHKQGIIACNYFRNALTGKVIGSDTFEQNYFNLTRDFVSIQNIAGYETLKSKGLEIVTNDSLRYKIISLYEYDFKTLLKLEEEYKEMQFHDNYFQEINNLLSSCILIDSTGRPKGFSWPINLEEKEKNKLLLYLWKIQTNRNFILYYYAAIESKVGLAIESIEKELNK